MIFTNVSCIGDFFLLWPVASAYYKQTGDKIHWVVTKNYYMYPMVESTLRYQDFTKDVSFVDVGTDAWDWRQWKFKPSDYGIEGDYMNFGFTQDMHGKYIPDFYASLYGLKSDNDYCIKMQDYLQNPFEKVTMRVESKPELWAIWKKMMPSDVIDLADWPPGYSGYDGYQGIIENPAAFKIYADGTWFPLRLWHSAKAKERYFGCSSSAVLMDLMNLPCTIFTHPSFGDPEIYYRNRFHTIVQT